MKFHAPLIALLLAACASTPAATREVDRIVSTTSFGMCVGYCSTRLEITPGQAVLIRDARGGRGAPNLPEQRFATPLTAAEWEELTRLASQADIGGLPPVIGCPDCADGGAESLTISGGDESQTISFDFGASIEEAQPLLARVRALRERLTPPE